MADGKHGVQHLGRKHVAILATVLYTIRYPYRFLAQFCGFG